MSEAVLISAFLLIAGAIGTLAKLLYDHVQNDKEVYAKISEIAGDVKRIKEDVGSHETGLRGTVHKTANRVTEIDMRVAMLERRKEHER